MHPVIYNFGPVAIHSYGLMLGIAFIIGILLAVKLGQKNGIEPDHIVNLGIFILIAAVIGSRAFYIIENLDEFKGELSQIFKFWSGGFVFYGGFIAAILISYLYCYKTKISFFIIADSMSPSIAIGLVLARIGCFLGGCCFGKPTNCFLTVTFPPNSPPAYAFGPDHHIHPVQLYGSVAGLILFIILIWLTKRKKFNGQVFWVLLILYPILRIILESFREHVDRALFLGFSFSQLISPLIILAGIMGYIFTQKKSSKKIYNF
ncbi:MAG: prolipoprotein diacylglyceryl transferase [Candidatus Schekmanbacteria bacterium RBG_13_48_7]|uniref:Phosphatidylglycerol--prolipoprotein diacylglyceryl transferase n=1 Tax=Candidatus Schekmanbacteria bacterium RBG_13_48_7 TaxID=1817878 RepID=A0A1F7RPA8_9BACT|nr:MAG: prolipoprotein diacylglyceryl transferase [Candidatus Schekmanbacteria bacterium RBG_13_48_7]